MLDFESIQTTPIEELRKQLDNYEPPQGEIKKATVLVRALEKCETAGVVVSVYGGYGLDGLYGKLTRSHYDGDLICEAGHEAKTCDFLETVGFKSVPVEGGEKWVITDPVFGDFDVEIVSWLALKEMTTLSKENFFPSVLNAILFGKKFRAVTLEGHKEIVEIMKKRNIQPPPGFGPYPSAKILNREMLFRVLESTTPPHRVYSDKEIGGFLKTDKLS